MCLECGTALNVSNSKVADQERTFIAELIAQGMTKQEVKDALVAEYGPRVLATPSGHGFDLAAWIVPGLLLALAIVGLFVGAFRLVRRSPPPPAPVPLDPADEARLDRDLSSYDP